MIVKRQIFLTVFSALVMQFAFAQQKEISGTVEDSDGTPLPGVNITIEGTNNGTQTNFDGKYKINAKSGQTLVFTYVGMEDKRKKVKDSNIINVTMTEGSKLDEVVVVGYGTQKKEDLTGSTAKIKGEKLKQRPVHSFQDALAGEAPGINVAHRNSAVGDVGSTFIRGIGSISANTEPLFVVDGFPTNAENANAINPDDIESIDVLKDASSTAIYGSRGANGVIQITTKSGHNRKLKINVSARGGFGKADKSSFYDLLNGDEYTEWYKEKAQHAGNETPDYVKDWDGTNTNWQDEIYRTAPFQDYSISASGGTDRMSYLFSAGFIDQKDILLNAGYQKVTARAKLDFEPNDRISFGANIAPSFTIQKKSAPDDDYSSLTGAAVHLPPIIPARNEDGSPTDPNSFGILNKEMANPLEIADKFQEKNNDTYLLANLYGKVKIIEGLDFKTTIGANLTHNKHKLYQLPLRGQALSPETNLDLNSSQTINWVNENTLKYKRKIHGVHKFDVLLGYSIEKTNTENVQADANTFPSDLPRTIDFGEDQNASSGKTSNSLLSYYARFNYSFREKYLITGTFRRDGSSRFGKNNRWGTFPSIAVGWNLSKENFFKGINFVDNAKIRASYGKTGSNSIGDFNSMPSLNSEYHSFNGTDVIGLINEDPGNPNLSWEVSKQFDLGLEAGLFDNRISMEFDYYHDLTQDLLLEVNVPPSVGFSSNLSNIGKMKKWGYEGTLNAHIIKNKDWDWNLGFNITYMDHKIKELGPSGDPLRWFFDVLVTPVGGHLEEEHVLKQTGILTQEDLDNGVAHKPGDQPGDIKFYDANDDGKIDAYNGKDGVLMGDNNPHLLYGINTSLRYKNFEFSALLNGQGGAELLDFVYQSMSSHGNNTNMSTKFYDGRWQSEDKPGDGITPRAGYNDEGAVSSWEIQSTDFLRIRNLSLGYTFPESINKKLGVKDLKASISVENVYTFTSFEGGNPQATRLGSGRVVGNGRTISLNSVSTPPLPRTFSLGVNFSF